MSSSKTAIISFLRERDLCIFEKKRKGEELTNLRDETGSSRRWWRWRRRQLDSLDGAMVRI
jgi:hypothetical protein